MRIYRVLTACLLMGACLGSAPAFAQDCETLVVDEAGRLGSDLSEVNAATKRLEDLGATVRVRTLRDYSNAGNLSAGNLDLYKDRLMDHCRSWQSADGGMRNTLIVLIVEMEHRQTGLYYGDMWRPALDEKWIGIQTGVMRPLLRDGNFSGAFSRTLDKVADLAAQQLNPPAPVAQAPAVEREIIREREVIQKEPTDYSGLVRVLAWLVGIVAIALSFWWLTNVIRRRKQEIESRRAAKLEAEGSLAVCANEIAGTFNEDVTLLQSELTELEKVLAEEELAPAKKMLSTVQISRRAAIAEYGRLSETGEYDPGRDDLSVPEYAAIQKAYKQVGGELSQGRTALEEIKKRVSDLTEGHAKAQATLKESAHGIDKARDAIGEVFKDGFKTDRPVAMLSQAYADLTAGTQAFQKGRLTACYEHIAKANEKVREAVDLGTGFPKRKADLGSKVVFQTKFLSGLEGRSVAVRKVFEEISDEYAEASWTPIAGNGTEAENRIGWAKESLEHASAAASMDIQDWDKAEAELEKAVSWMGEAVRLLNTIVELKANLENAKAKCDRELTLAGDDIQKAKDYLREYGEDIEDDFEASILGAERLLREAYAEREKSKPDYPKVVKLALAANKAADDFYNTAEQQHHFMERQRHQDQSLGEEITRSINGAAQYIRNHGSDTGSEAKRLLDEAEDLSDRRLRTEDLKARIEIGIQADKKADAALAKAKRNVDDAEDARDRARQRSTSISVGSSRSWGSSSGGSGRSLGGGGSIGIGRSSRGGGGSVGW